MECPKGRDPEDSDKQETLGGDAILVGCVRTWLKEADLECLARDRSMRTTKAPRHDGSSIRDRLANAGYAGIPDESQCAKEPSLSCPLRPQTPRSVRFGAWIMPDNRSKGMLEDFVRGLIRDDDSHASLSSIAFLDSIPEEQRRFSPTHEPKARIHSWLAVERAARPADGSGHQGRQLPRRASTRRFSRSSIGSDEALLTATDAYCGFEQYDYSQQLNEDSRHV